LKPGRLISPPGTYFVTFSTWQRRRLFVVENCVRIFLTSLFKYRRDGRYQLHAFVVMPEHVHLLLTPAEDVTLEHAVQLIKGGSSHALGPILGPKREIWQRGFTDHRIRGAQDYEHHEDYIHQNPVVQKIVSQPRDYKYSSVLSGYRLDPWPSAAKAEISKSA
jgi:putative transposase